MKNQERQRKPRKACTASATEYSTMKAMLAASEGRYPYTLITTGQISSVQLAPGPKTTVYGGTAGNVDGKSDMAKRLEGEADSSDGLHVETIRLG